MTVSHHKGFGRQRITEKHQIVKPPPVAVRVKEETKVFEGDKFREGGEVEVEVEVERRGEVKQAIPYTT